MATADLMTKYLIIIVCGEKKTKHTWFKTSTVTGTSDKLNARSQESEENAANLDDCGKISNDELDEHIALFTLHNLTWVRPRLKLT